MANTKVTSNVIADDINLGGNPTTTTQSAGNNTTRIATTAFVKAAIDATIDSAPGALDTLNELAAAIGDDANFSTTITNSIATKAPLDSPVFSSTYTSGQDEALAEFRRDGGAVAAKVIYADASTDMEFGTTTSHAFSLITADTRRLTISNTGDVTFTGALTGTTASFETSSTTDHVLRLTDTGAINYDFKFPDTATIQLETHASNDKMLKLSNTAGGDFNLTVGGAVMIGGTLHDEWHSDYIGLEIGHSGFVYNRTSGNELFATSNAYYDSGWKFSQSGRAAMLDLQSGRVRARTSNATGSQDGAITWVNAIDIAADTGRITTGNNLKIQGGSAYSAANVSEANNSNMALLVAPQRSGVNLGFSMGDFGSIGGLQAFVTSTNAASDFHMQPFGAGVKIGATASAMGSYAFSSNNDQQVSIPYLMSHGAKDSNYDVAGSYVGGSGISFGTNAIFRTPIVASPAGQTASTVILTVYSSGHWGEYPTFKIKVYGTYYVSSYREYLVQMVGNAAYLREVEVWDENTTFAYATAPSITMGAAVDTGTDHSSSSIYRRDFTLVSGGQYLREYAVIEIMYGANRYYSSGVSQSTIDGYTNGGKYHFRNLTNTEMRGQAVA